MIPIKTIKTSVIHGCCPMGTLCTRVSIKEEKERKKKIKNKLCSCVSLKQENKKKNER